jgi:translation initiation factor IF-3
VRGGRTDTAKEQHISEPRINDRIRVPEVRLVGPNGEQVGIVRVEDALRLAQEADLDLVEVAPQARPPVCKLMDFGKYKYESDMKAREARRNQAHTVLKEIRLRLKIDPHDYGTKRGHVERFLKQGDKVKVMIMFRGREQSRPEMGYRLLQRMAADVAEFGYVESTPKQDGRNMIMVIGPHKKKAEAKAEQKAERRRRDEELGPRGGAPQRSSGPASAEPFEIEPEQIEPEQIESEQVEPEPVQSVQAEPAPEQPAQPQPVQAQPAPEQPAPEQAAPEQAAPEQAAPEQPAPARPGSARPAQAQPAPARPAQAQPAPARPAPARPAQPAPARPAQAQPAPAKPAAPRPPAKPGPRPTPTPPPPGQARPAPPPRPPAPGRPTPAPPTRSQPASAREAAADV